MFLATANVTRRLSGREGVTDFSVDSGAFSTLGWLNRFGGGPSFENPTGLKSGMGIGMAMSGMGSGMEMTLALNGESVSSISLIRYLAASFPRYLTSRRLILLAMALKASSSSKLPGALSGILGRSE